MTLRLSSARSLARLAAACLAGLASAAPGQTTISLRTSARLSPDAQEVRLADIAEIAGQNESEFGRTVIVPETEAAKSTGWLKVEVAEVRDALDRALGGTNWGRVSLHGGTCTVRFTDARLSTRESVGADRAAANRPAARMETIDTDGLRTIKAEVAVRLAAVYGVTPDRIQLAFDPADAEVLATLVGARQVDVSPGGLGTSSRLPVTVTLYDGERVSLSRTMQVSALVYRSVIVASETLDRGRAITADQVNQVEQWTAPPARPPVTIGQVVAATAQKRINAGEIIEAEDIAPPLACKRGDVVIVHCLSGSVVVKVQARAMASARDGEIVQLKFEMSEAPITARMSGPGRAVVVASAQGGFAAKSARNSRGTARR
ncbi:MAG: flagellar basal body P-ring formation protein FlgA [Phycisphaerales bacterium]|nr:flagellar basal body P-ring formation protein FlgA [Phycisphaerales bacterium]